MEAFHIMAPMEVGAIKMQMEVAHFMVVLVAVILNMIMTPINVPTVVV